MSRVVEAVMDRMSSADGLQNAAMTLDIVLETDRLARVRASDVVNSLR
jgi:1-deoxy-D-xylulose-5-phosphate reductoisomerase